MHGLINIFKKEKSSGIFEPKGHFQFYYNVLLMQDTSITIYPDKTKLIN